jgi:hypothetical protein
MTSRNRSSEKSRRRREPSALPPLSLGLSSADVRKAVDAILGDVLTAADGIGERDDPFEAELFAAGLRAALCAAGRVVMDDGDDALGIALARAAEDAGGPGALALLRAVEATWPDPVATRARSGANRLERRGVPAPSWADALRRVSLEQVSMAEDPHGDVALMVATFSYGGERRHRTAALVDYNMRGMVMKAWLPDEAMMAGLLQGVVPELTNIEFRPSDPAHVAAILAAGLEVRRAADSEIAERRENEVGQRAVLSLLEARLRRFPRPARAGRSRTPSPRACGRLVVDFLTATACDDLGVEPEHVEFVIRQLIDFKVRYGDGDPLRWSPTVVRAFMGEWFPRKATTDPEAIQCLPDVVRRWVSWAGRGRGLASDLVERTLTAVDESKGAFQEACRDRSRFMPAKAVATAMRDDGVDIADPAAVDAWFQSFRRSSPKRQAEKLGQNLAVARVFVEDDRIVVAVTRPASEPAKNRHLLGV